MVYALAGASPFPFGHNPQSVVVSWNGGELLWLGNRPGATLNEIPKRHCFSFSNVWLMNVLCMLRRELERIHRRRCISAKHSAWSIFWFSDISIDLLYRLIRWKKFVSQARPKRVCKLGKGEKATIGFLYADYTAYTYTTYDKGSPTGK